MKYVNIISLVLMLAMGIPEPLGSQEEEKNGSFYIHPEFDKRIPNIIAVLPMENLSLEPNVEVVLYNEVYSRLKAKGYRRISVETVLEKMGKLGIQTPGQLSGFSFETIGKELQADAVLWGGIEQSADIHGIAYDAIVVMSSLYLIDCKTGDILWSCEQWRTAHRQFQLDPINGMINAIMHIKGSREDRVAWLVQEMLKSLPDGRVKVVEEDLLNKAFQIEADKY